MALLWVAVACARPGSGPPAGTVTAPPTSAARTTAPTSQPVVTVRGTVRAGVEAGCLVLDAGERQYLLLGGEARLLRLDAEVVVEGRPDPGRVTTCQQGIPFHVTAVVSGP